MISDGKDIPEVLEAENFDGVHTHDDDDDLKEWCKEQGFKDFDKCLEYIDDHDDDDDDDELDDEEKALIIGLVVAGVIILGLIIFLIVAKVKKCCCFKPKNKNGTTKEELVKDKSSPLGSDCESGNNPVRMSEKGDRILNSNNNNNINNNNDEIVYPTFGFGDNQMQGVPNQMTLVDFTNSAPYNNMNIANDGMVQNPDVYPNVIYPQPPNYQVNSPGIYAQPQMGNMMQQGQL